MSRIKFAIARSVALIAIVISTGCAPMTKMVTNAEGGHRLQAAEAVNDDLHVEVPEVVIINGAGAWATNAFWDEYELVVTNKSSQLVSIDKVHLEDATGAAIYPSTNWDELERVSGANKRKLVDAGVAVTAGAGIPIAVGLATASPGWWGTTYAATASTTAAALLPVTAAAAAVGYMAKSAKQEEHRTRITAEMIRRTTQFSREIAVSNSSRGRFFFPITPCPKAMVLHYSVGDMSRSIEVPLTELNNLHLHPKKAARRGCSNLYADGSQARVTDRT